jgi:hypothetical protein
MIKSEFERAIKEVPKGTPVYLVCRGNYGDFHHNGLLEKFQDGYIHLDNGFAHHYSRVKTMTAMTNFKPYLRCKMPTENCKTCEFLKQCQELNPEYNLIS